MANLKQDLVNDLGNEKYYSELELARLAADPNMNYKCKVDTMAALLKNLASVDLATQLIGKYFPEEQQAQAPAPQVEAPVAEQPQQPAPHQGQTHAE